MMSYAFFICGAAGDLLWVCSAKLMLSWLLNVFMSWLIYCFYWKAHLVIHPLTKEVYSKWEHTCCPSFCMCSSDWIQWMSPWLTITMLSLSWKIPPLSPSSTVAEDTNKHPFRTERWYKKHLRIIYSTFHTHYTQKHTNMWVLFVLFLVFFFLFKVTLLEEMHSLTSTSKDVLSE